jgi:hypothetical protein
MRHWSKVSGSQSAIQFCSCAATRFSKSRSGGGLGGGGGKGGAGARGGGDGGLGGSGGTSEHALSCSRRISACSPASHSLRTQGRVGTDGHQDIPGVQV